MPRKPRAKCTPKIAAESLASVAILPGDYIVSEAQVSERRGVSRSTHRRDVEAGRWPPPVFVSRRRKGWLNSVVETELGKAVARSEALAAARAERQPNLDAMLDAVTRSDPDFAARIIRKIVDSPQTLPAAIAVR